MRQMNMSFPELAPIDEQQRQQVRERTDFFIRRAAELFERPFPDLPVLFDLRGRCAGMYRVYRGERCIRYNPQILAADLDMGLRITVPHEVAHYIADRLFGLANIRPHGREWQQIMRAFGIDQPRATGRYDLQGIPQRQYRHFEYHCGCRQHQLTSIRHNRVQGGRARYYCRVCNGELHFSGRENS